MTPESTASSLLGRDALIVATTVGLILQFAMVVAGHYSAPVKASFAIGGMLFSLVAGFLYFRLAPGGWAALAGPAELRPLYEASGAVRDFYHGQRNDDLLSSSDDDVGHRPREGRRRVEQSRATAGSAW